MPVRTLILWRHAKSDWSSPAEGDFDRPLNARGRRDAPAAAAFIAGRLPRPGLILCSPARRTRETLEALAPLLAPPPPVQFPKAIYEAAPESLLAEVRAAEDADTVLMLGHNPGIYMLAMTLTDGLGSADFPAAFPAGACAVLESGAEWKNLGPGGARLAQFIRSEDL